MIKKNLFKVQEVIKNLNVQQKVKLVAVSKTKPNEQLMECYECGQRHFGENYVQELVSKAASLPKDIQWHFIGKIQSNKCRILSKIENLYCIETLDRKKIAKILNEELDRELNVFVQVNTSKEEQKGGIPIDQVTDFVQYILDECPKLRFKGLMTIGHPEGGNLDFITLSQCRDEIVKSFNMDKEDIELSMGMSSDYVEAIKHGSTSVRVGTTIFGARQTKN